MNFVSPIRLLLLALALVVPWGVSAWAQALAPYTLRPADRLQVSVWRDTALQRDVRVLPDGSITLPLVGRIVVAGLDTDTVEKQIVERLKPFMPDPIVTVAVAAAEGNVVYVVGKVVKPGVVPLITDSTTVLQALSLVGGLDRFADGNAVRVLRELGGGKRAVMDVRYNDLIKGDKLQTNVVLQAGDTILVP
ncbi:MAG: polysaccharide biosynthesis/export family protein [Comamonas sp.]|nr:polysaccharide biosynthesis/export family protein [Comamonas sp.]